MGIKSINETSVTKDHVERYLVEEIIDKKLSKSKLQLSVAALNFRFNTFEEKFKLKATKYKGGKNKWAHFAYSKEQLEEIF